MYRLHTDLVTVPGFLHKVSELSGDDDCITGLQARYTTEAYCD